MIILLPTAYVYSHFYINFFFESLFFYIKMDSKIKMGYKLYIEKGVGGKSDISGYHYNFIYFIN